MNLFQTIIMIIAAAWLLYAIYKQAEENFKDVAEAEAEEKVEKKLRAQRSEIKRLQGEVERLQYQLDHPTLEVKTIGRW